MGLLKRILRKVTNTLKKHKTIYNVLSKIRNTLSSAFKIKADFELYQKLLLMANQIPKYRGSSYFNKFNTTFAIITDEFMYNYYKDIVNLIYITPSNYKQVLDNEHIDYVWFISCWRGVGEKKEWQGRSVREKAVDVYKYAKGKGIKTVFQTIEDPVSYSNYLGIAKYADYIFTTAVEKIEAYKEDTGNQNVFLLEYGVNPSLHNPIGCFEKYYNKDLSEFKDSAFFAGSWMDKYEERCRDSRAIFDGVNKSKSRLVIADRNYNIPKYNFPFKYRKSIVPPIDYRVIQDVHKLFKFNINVNSVKYSKTMCARRVYEAQGFGGLLISNYSLSISSIFPNIFFALTQTDSKILAKSYSEKNMKDMQVLAIRNVYTNLTVYDKLNYVFKCMGCEVCDEDRVVYVVTEQNKTCAKKLLKNQTYKNIEIISVHEFDTLALGSGYWIMIDETKQYNKDYILDLVNAFKYTNGDFVTYNNNCAYRYTNTIEDMASTLFNIHKVTVEDIKVKTHAFNGFAIYDSNSESDELQEDMSDIAVIIPVYNNGNYLRDRCFNSLLRSTIFNKMHIYIIDDGSTDEVTINIIEELKQKHHNITTHYFNDGGSGSAARPRNKGVELCEEKYVTYLDPDNEATNDGYAKLYEIMKKTNVDMAFGTISRITDKVITLRYKNGSGVIQNPKKNLIRNKFKPQSVQACLIKKALLKENNIVNAVGALGEDTLFFYELMLNARMVYHVDKDIHLYYAERDGSSLNKIEKSMFIKFKRMEERQAVVLKQHGVLEDYKKEKLDHYIRHRYEDRLSLIIERDRTTCKQIMAEIKDLYRD